ncbi:hypothetical protein RJ639_007780 [Escallonia herrerae]|uniref:Uncharacterized protein n=1 Tax=Escallonia herrerae TaxID=1293975 RepID=A0AA88VXE1_9ASTE|nr:hypothetical protein RJ639_007780 [Escallonia herrerae]
MAEAGYGIPVRNVNPLPIPYPATEARSISFQRRPSIIRATSSKKNEFSPITRKSYRSPRRLVKVSTAEGRWLGKWDTDYTLSLRDLQLEDLADDGNQRAQVFISLSIEKETCSDSCEKAEPRLHRIGEQNTASVDRRWSSLLELRRKYG